MGCSCNAIAASAFAPSSGAVAAMLRQILLPWRSLPQRALAKKKGKKQQKKTAAAPEIRLAPYLPPEFTKETRHFFENQPRMKALLELVFSPLEPQEKESDRLSYE